MSSNPPPDAATRRRFSFLPTTLTGRLVLTSITLVAAVSIVVAVVTTLALRSFLLDRLDDQLHEATAALKAPCRTTFPSHPTSCACSSSSGRTARPRVKESGR